MPSQASIRFPVHSFETYLDIEAHATGRHEFYHGQIHAMAGGDLKHDTIKTSATLLIESRLNRTSCFTTSSDFKIATPKLQSAFYPDLAVHCHPRPTTRTDLLQAPCLVLEVLSPSTRNYDLTNKRKEYFRIPTLRHYLLLDSESIEALLFTREANQTWPKDPQVFTDPKATIPLTALNINLKLKDLYLQSGLLTLKP